MESYEQKKKNSDILALIGEYKACPELWNPSDINYLNDQSKIEAWVRIASRLHLPQIECKKKIFELLSEYKRIRILEKQLEENGEKLEKPWFAYAALKFLEERDATKLNDMSMPNLNDSNLVRAVGTDVSKINYLKIVAERRVLTDILKIYKESRCLWDPKPPLYASQRERMAKYNMMLEKWKEIDPECNIDSLKKRLANCRSVYRKERRKVERSRTSDNVYKPTLWYYDLMRFIDEVDGLVSSNVPKDSNECSSDVDTNMNSDDEKTVRGNPTEREVLIDIFKTYKKLRVLWHRKNPYYNDPDERSSAYNILLEKWQKIEPKYSVDDIKRKLINFRTVYNKQKKRVDIMKKRGKKYTPTLWYYEHLRFLDDEKVDLDAKIECSENMKDEDTTASNEFYMNYQDTIQDQEEWIEPERHEPQKTIVPNPPKLSNQSKPSNPPKPSNPSKPSNPRKCNKRKLPFGRPLMAEAVELLGSTAKRLQADDEPKEIKRFCSYISSKMCSYPVKMQREIEHAIYDVLVKADCGFFEQSDVDEPKFKNNKNIRVREPRSTFGQSLQSIDQSTSRRSLRLAKKETIPFEEFAVIEKIEQPMSSPSQHSMSGSEHENVQERESVWLIDNYKLG